MKFLTFLAAALALCNWTFVMSSKAMAHGGTTFAVLDCHDDDGDKDGTLLDCHDDDGDKDGTLLDCHDDDEQEQE